MADKTSFTMNVKTPSNQDSTRSITDISSNASDSQIIALAQGLNDLTDNTLEAVNKVTKKELSLAAKSEREGFGISQFRDATFTLAEIISFMGTDAITSLDDANCDAQSDGKKPYIDVTQTTSQFPASYYLYSGDYSSHILILAGIPEKLNTVTDNNIQLTGKIVCKIDESDTHKGYTCTITITE